MRRAVKHSSRLARALNYGYAPSREAKHWREGEHRQIIRSMPPASARGSSGTAGAGADGGSGGGGRKEAFLQDLEADMENEIARQQSVAKEQYNAVMRHHQPPPETHGSFGRQMPSQATLTTAHSNGTALHSNGTASSRASFSNPSSAGHYGRHMTPQTTFYHGPASALSTPEQLEDRIDYRGKAPESKPGLPQRRGRSLSRSSQDSMQRPTYPPPRRENRNTFNYSEHVAKHPTPGSIGVGYTPAGHPPPSSRDEPVSELERLFRESARMRGV
jgi:hypothetical protein